MSNSPIGEIITETVTFTLAEIHVHGILGGLAFVLGKFGNEVKEDHVAIGLTLVGGLIIAYFFRKRNKEAMAKLKAQLGHRTGLPPQKRTVAHRTRSRAYVGAAGR